MCPRVSIRRAATVMLGALVLAAAGPASAKELTPREIYKQYAKGVVLVFATDGSAQGSAGTGSIISKDGQIITNAHVVAQEGKPYKKVFVYLKPDKIVGSMKDDLKYRFKATIIDLEPALDLALLKMDEPPADLTTISFVDPDSVEIGEPVVAIGHPETGGLWTLTSGAISSVVKDFQGIEGKDVFQTEASVNRGNSGGPLLNAYGQMVGINTCISRRAADGLAITDINFSLKSSVPVEWMKRRKLLELAYVKPESGDSGSTGTMVAQAETKPAKTDGAAGAAKAEVTKNADGSQTVKVEGDDGSKIVAIVEPEKGQEVAEDPDFNKQGASASANVSGTMTVKGAKGTKTTVKAKPADEEKPKAKVLTKARPYKLEPFVAARIKEIKALEDIMKDSEKELERRMGGKRTKKPDTSGNGLW
ncbi:serine protease [Myxococcota bacterium]|nr:serine protease [Myxococcota bacterium]